MIIYLSHLPIEKRKKARALLESMKATMVEQNKKYHELFIAPNEMAIQVIDDTLRRNPQTHILKSITECEGCIEITTERYKEVHKLFRRLKNGNKKQI
jgi:hypothetical protein